jgi:multiple sugar transport system ATP-binding protein
MGRALVREPSVFLLDEPLSNLDAKLRVQVRGEIEDLQRRTQTTMLYVTHDQVEAMTLGHRLAVLDQGRLRQVGTPRQVYERPADTFVAGFLGSPRMNFLPGALAGEQDVVAHVRLAGGVHVDVAADASRAAPGGPVTLGVRPEHLRLLGDREPGGIPATVALVEYLGDAAIVHARAEGVPEMIAVKCRTEGAAAGPAAGASVRLGFDPAYGHLFDGDGAAMPRVPPAQ